MTASFGILAALLLVVVGINVVATIVTMRSASYRSDQKWAQAVFIWLVPLLGGLLAWTLARDVQPRKRMPAKTAGGSEDAEIFLEHHSSHAVPGDASNHE